MDRLQDKKEKMAGLLAAADALIRKLFADEEGMQEYLEFYLKIKGRTKGYSVLNTAMIRLQFPQAQMVGSYGYWKEQGVNVNRGEHGIAILVPEERVGAYFKIGYVFDIMQTNADKEKMAGLLLKQSAEYREVSGLELLEATMGKAAEEKIRLDMFDAAGRTYADRSSALLHSDNPAIKQAGAAIRQIA